MLLHKNTKLSKTLYLFFDLICNHRNYIKLSFNKGPNVCPLGGSFTNTNEAKRNFLRICLSNLRCRRCCHGDTMVNINNRLLLLSGYVLASQSLSPSFVSSQLSAVISIPLWQWFLQRFGKKTAAFCGISVRTHSLYLLYLICLPFDTSTCGLIGKRDAQTQKRSPSFKIKSNT